MTSLFLKICSVWGGFYCSLLYYTRKLSWFLINYIHGQNPPLSHDLRFVLKKTSVGENSVEHTKKARADKIGIDVKFSQVFSLCRQKTAALPQ